MSEICLLHEGDKFRYKYTVLFLGKQRKQVIFMLLFHRTTDAVCLITYNLISKRWRREEISF